MRSIILIRHGPTAHKKRGWLSAAEAARWLESYDSCGIRPKDPAPAELLKLASAADAIISSDLPRALESAERLACGRHVVATVLLRECQMQVSPLPLRMPLSLWHVDITVRWLFLLLSRNSRARAELQRAKTAARWLIGLTSLNNCVLVITHNAFRALLLRYLNTNGWLEETRWRKYGPWSARVLTPPHASISAASV